MAFSSMLSQIPKPQHRPLPHQSLLCFVSPLHKVTPLPGVVPWFFSECGSIPGSDFGEGVSSSGQLQLTAFFRHTQNFVSRFFDALACHMFLKTSILFRILLWRILLWTAERVYHSSQVAHLALKLFLMCAFLHMSKSFDFGAGVTGA